MSIDKNSEVQKFDSIEAEILGGFQEAGGTEEGVATATAIIADERKHVASGEETAEDGQDNVDQRVIAAFSAEADDDCGCDCGGCE